ncbi:hypothetical protein ON010_g2341 [Phytophthora cinnamomi]|nr:hypothetical protein ON010_g2341 [Phytophthora cinnamomi]
MFGAAAATTDNHMVGEVTVKSHPIFGSASLAVRSGKVYRNIDSVGSPGAVVGARSVPTTNDVRSVGGLVLGFDGVFLTHVCLPCVVWPTQGARERRRCGVLRSAGRAHGDRRLQHHDPGGRGAAAPPGGGREHRDSEEDLLHGRGHDAADGDERARLPLALARRHGERVFATQGAADSPLRRRQLDHGTPATGQRVGCAWQRCRDDAAGLVQGAIRQHFFLDRPFAGASYDDLPIFVDGIGAGILLDVRAGTSVRAGASIDVTATQLNDVIATDVVISTTSGGVSAGRLRINDTGIQFLGGTTTISSEVASISLQSAKDLSLTAGSLDNKPGSKVIIRSGASNWQLGGDIDVKSGQSNYGAASGKLLLHTADSIASHASSGSVEIGSGIGNAGPSGVISLSSGNASTGDSGDILILTGSASGANSGDIAVETSPSTGGSGGSVQIAVGVGDVGAGGIVAISAGSTVDPLLQGGSVFVNAGSSRNLGGNIQLSAADGVSQSGTSATGGSIIIVSGKGTPGCSGDITLQTSSSSTSGSLTLSSGASSGGNSGSVSLLTSKASGGASGSIIVRVGSGDAAVGGDVQIGGGTSVNQQGVGGRVLVQGGNGTATGGNVQLSAGSGTSALSGSVLISSGSGNSATSGDVTVSSAASGTALTSTSGSVRLSSGASSGGSSGSVSVSTVEPGRQAAAGRRRGGAARAAGAQRRRGAARRRLEEHQLAQHAAAALQPPGRRLQRPPVRVRRRVRHGRPVPPLPGPVAAGPQDQRLGGAGGERRPVPEERPPHGGLEELPRGVRRLLRGCTRDQVVQRPVPVQPGRAQVAEGHVPATQADPRRAQRLPTGGAPVQGPRSEGKVYSDLWALNLAPVLKRQSPTWEKLSRKGQAPSPRGGAAVTVHKQRFILFGGVFDEEKRRHTMQSTFYNDLFVYDMDRRRWFEFKLRGKKSTDGKRRRKKKSKTLEDGAAGESGDEDDEEEDEEVEDFDTMLEKQFGYVDDEGNIVYIEDAHEEEETKDGEDGDDDDLPKEARSAKQLELELEEEESKEEEKEEEPVVAAAEEKIEEPEEEEPAAPAPCPRINPAVMIRGSTLYVYGGVVEDGDREITLDDCWSLDLKRLEEWKQVLPGTMSQQIWKGEMSETEESSDGDDDDDDDDFDDDDEDEDDDEDDVGRIKAREEKAKAKAMERAMEMLAKKDGDAEGDDADDAAKKLGLGDVDRTPQMGENLRDFFARTDATWAREVMARPSTVEHELSIKEIKREGFLLAEARYQELLPVLERLNALELEQKEAEELHALKKKGSKEKSRR